MNGFFLFRFAIFFILAIVATNSIYSSEDSYTIATTVVLFLFPVTLDFWANKIENFYDKFRWFFGFFAPFLTSICTLAIIFMASENSYWLSILDTSDFKMVIAFINLTIIGLTAADLILSSREDKDIETTQSIKLRNRGNREQRRKAARESEKHHEKQGNKKRRKKGRG